MIWRIGKSYGIHIYQGNEPIGTIFDRENAKEAVRAVNFIRSIEVMHTVVKCPACKITLGETFVVDEVLSLIEGHLPSCKALKTYDLALYPLTNGNESVPKEGVSNPHTRVDKGSASPANPYVSPNEVIGQRASDPDVTNSLRNAKIEVDGEPTGAYSTDDTRRSECEVCNELTAAELALDRRRAEHSADVQASSRNARLNATRTQHNPGGKVG